MIYRIINLKNITMEKNTFTVSQIVKIINEDLNLKYKDIKILGEISTFKPWRSGFSYFDIKDNSAILSAILVQNHHNQIKFKITDGLKIIANGNLSIYSPKSKLQLFVKSIEPIGIGESSLSLQRLKEKLEIEGLFSSTLKKTIPYIPSTIGIVTSPQSAVFQDLLFILHQRMPCLNIIFAPSRVQGENSEQEISNAIKLLDSKNCCDLIIIARGGGAYEDLQSFNQEIVARTIFNCTTPIISSIGHENDYCIADFVADIRCSTPSHAAQIATPIQNEVISKLHVLKLNLKKEIDKKIYYQKSHISNLFSRLISPTTKIQNQIQQMKIFYTKLNHILFNILQQHKQHVTLLKEKLNILSPLNILNRGYSVVYKSNKIISNIADLNKDDKLLIRILNGFLEVRVEKKWNLNQ